ncbi:MAG TPA: alpha-glycosidase [Clostridiaceae bacterium]|nr:alpha-glycosidase [Clostridiaceae bacterium]
MNKQAIFHITDVPYAYAEDENNLFLMLRASQGDLKSCKVLYKDRYDWQNPFHIEDMECKNSDGLFDYFETKIHVDGNRYRYNFRIEGTDGEVFYYNERGFSKEPEEERGAFQFPFISPADVYKKVKWAQEGIIYQIFPDRFYNGDKGNDPEGVLPWGGAVDRKSMFGGDLRGIMEKLPYLKDLGVTILYLTPVFLSSSNHKYNTKDYYKIDPHFGDIKIAKELVKNAHKLGIKVLFDAVFNHCGSDFFAFSDVLSKQEKSAYKDWFFIKSFPVSTDKINYVTFANNVSTMPKLNTGNTEVKKYLLDVSKYWIKETGIDGWRLDVCDEVDHSFWRGFRKVVKKAKPDSFIVGEIQHEACSWLKGDQLDSIMNYPFKEVMNDFFAKRKITAEKFDNELSAARALYMKNINMNLLNLLDSHDTPRFLTECGGDVCRMKLAVAFQYTYIGMPYIYYGDEVGMLGGNDPLCRKCMIWDDSKQNKELLEFYRTLNHIRKENKALVYGDYKTIYKNKNIIAFKRMLNNEKIIVILNNSDDDLKVRIEGIAGSYLDLLNGKEVNIENNIELPGNGIKILKAALL